LDHRVNFISFFFIFFFVLDLSSLIVFFFFFPSTSFLCLLSFVLLLPPHLFVPCATSNYCLIELLPILLLLHHLVLLPWPIASSCCLNLLPCHVVLTYCLLVALRPHYFMTLFHRYFVRYFIALLRHCLVHYFVTSSCYLTTPPCCLVTLPHCPTSLPHVSLCCHRSLLHWLVSLPRCLKVPFTPPHLLFCCLVASLLHCFVLAGISLLLSILQEGAWSLEKQTFYEPLKKVNIFF
jgi:hypothetical protein